MGGHGSEKGKSNRNRSMTNRSPKGTTFGKNGSSARNRSPKGSNSGKGDASNRNRSPKGANSGKNGSGKNGSSSKGSTGKGGKGAQICRDYEKQGWCRFGDQCNFQHPGSPGKQKRSSGNLDSKEESRRFVLQLTMTKNPERIPQLIEEDGARWSRCWEDAPSKFDFVDLEKFVIFLAKLPPSVLPPPPPAQQCCKTLEKYLTKIGSQHSADPGKVAQAAEVAMNVVKCLLRFEWELSVDEVKDALMGILSKADQSLQKAHKDHRETGKRITELMEDLDKPWKIKQKVIARRAGADHVPDSSDSAVDLTSHQSWRCATIGWLCQSELFAPSCLPKMQVPEKSKSGGVYDSPDHYFDTVERLMVAMAFSDGNATLMPRCRQTGSNGSTCGSQLWPIQHSEGLRCRTRNCHGSVAFACGNRYHQDGLCKRCAEITVNLLMGPPGPQASTHIYDGIVSYTDADGRLYIRNFASRCPPTQHAIHWKSTKRLSSPNLVGVVRLASWGTSLKKQDPILWGEISLHGQPQYEAKRRQDGDLVLNMTSITGDFDPDILSEGDNVAIVDCMTFVPEYIPVLRALEKQRESTLPFKEGDLFNLRSSAPPDLSNTVGDRAHLSNIPLIVQDMIAESCLQPIVEIRRDEDLADRLNGELCSLVEKATLDKGQLVSFIDALRNPLHLTQGPPGTGKSYLGVVLVRALIIIRKFWVRKNSSVGTPPILVLSYKNHAIDEFLCDLVQAENNGGKHWRNPFSMIRIGGGASMDQRLQPYSEKGLQNKDTQITKCRDDINKLSKLGKACKDLCRSTSLFSSYQADIFDSQVGKPNGDKKRNKAAYEATEVLLASMVRSKLLNDELAKGDDSDDDDDYDLVHDLDFLALDDGDPKGRQTQRLMRRDQVLYEVPKLYDGIKHYMDMDDRFEDPGEIFLMFISGGRPLPMCSFVDDRFGQYGQCVDLASDHGVLLCNKHRCRLTLEDGNRCRSCVRSGDKYLCHEHACDRPGCQKPKLQHPQRLCSTHACFLCLKFGKVAQCATDDPPRNVCIDHPLCCATDCLNPALPNSDFCDDHTIPKCQASGLWWSCKYPAISNQIPFCRNHVKSRMSYYQPKQEKPEDNDFASAAGSEGEDLAETQLVTLICAGKNRRGKPCKAKAMPNSKYCHVHMPSEISFASQQQAAAAVAAAAAEVKDKAKAEARAQAEAAARRTGVDASVPPGLPSPVQGAPDQFQPEFQDPEIADLSFPDGEQPEIIDRADAGHYDNPDEVEEGDHLQHLREVFEVDDGKDSDQNDTDSLADSNEDDFADTAQGHATHQGFAETTFDIRFNDPKEWTWEMSLEERWEAVHSFLMSERQQLQVVIQQVKAQMPSARKQLHDAKVRASARVYENKSVIGGTIVGCISRLEAIRATNPFAIIVEEASEVLEPLLFSCFCPSTIKLEMIGDHLQLQPSIMQKFEFERINCVNVSMFERLIRAPSTNKVPSAVLSVQRRMRKDVCDLTREYYKEIVAIEDHEYCSTKLIPGAAAKRSVYKGREVPGVQSHIYLWTHSGDQSKAEVGLSKINRQEAKMACQLAYYLVSCGVPRSSIAILTPYKGQLMHMRKILLGDKSKHRLLAWDSSEADQIRMSTVDRFQGDEADVVIISLVVDEKSTTPFVKLQNRMIVLLSRARLGMFVLGNVGYFEKSRQRVPHWNRTFELLQKPPSATDNADATIAEVFDQSRVGPKLPLCCPQHPESRSEATNVDDLICGFCTIPCAVKLPCTHECNLPCHWRDGKYDQHNTSCAVQVVSPCARHPGEVTCKSVFDNSKATRGDTIDDALDSYRCPEKVPVTLPCSHEIKMTCAEELDISEDRAPWPRCNKTAHRPYVHPGCGHTLDVTCHMLQQYEANPAVVKRCAEKVEYVPPCGHPCQIACYLKQQYESGSAKFVCPKKVVTELPRCGHSKQVSCAEEIALRSWIGERCTEPGVVREGQSYGPRDHSCKTVVTFIRPCGHETEMPCEQAFNMAKVTVACLEKVECRNPHCGHLCKVPCHEAKKMQSMPQNEPVEILDESSIPPVPAAVANITCSKEVTVRRSCGHVQKIQCSRTSRGLPKCTEECKVRSPLCGHEVSVPCHMRATLSRLTIWNEEAWHELVEKQTLPAEASPLTSSLPESVLTHLKACRSAVKVVRPCGHTKKFDCKQLLKIVSDGEVKGACTERVTEPLRCGHLATVSCRKYQDYLAGKEDIVCKEKTAKPCWNVQLCGRSDLIVECACTATLCCDGLSDWTCPAGIHTFSLARCKNGDPLICPGCDQDSLKQAISTSEDASAKLDVSLPQIFEGLFADVVDLTVSKDVEDKFLKAKEALLRKFEDRVEESQPFDRQLFNPIFLECFYVLDQNQIQSHGKGFFPLNKFMKANTLNGIKVHRFTPANLRGLAKDKASVTLLCGRAFTLKALADASWPNKKFKEVQKDLKRWHAQGYDCIECKHPILQSLVIWDPFALYATHRVTLSREQLLEAADSLDNVGHTDIKPRSIAYKEPPGKPLKVVSASKASAAAPSAEPAKDKVGTAQQSPELRGTWAEDVLFPDQWESSMVAMAGEFPDMVQKELRQKLSLFNSSAAPFAGKNALENLSKSNTSPLVKLLLALEVHSKDGDRAIEHLQHYLDAMKGQVHHPLSLLAFYRMHGLQQALNAFYNLYPNAADLLLPAERDAILDVQDRQQGSAAAAEATDPAELWEELQQVHDCSSEAMGKLMALTGLKKVKDAAIKLFKMAVTFARMDPEKRKANMQSMNYCFLGNPGTGKTTVARLFAEVLRDSGLREKQVFVECTAQKLKDEGADEFRKKAQEALDGVLFIDEAYDLDPSGDKFKGAPIVNELVTLAENERHRLTVILAGYEDDMNSKLFSYNTGLKSRFQEVLFEDFDEKELTKIWTDMLNERGWTEADERLTTVAVRRIFKGVGKKGFGNAREVRKRLEQATANAMKRNDFDPDELVLQIVDVVGEDPRANSKLEAVVDEIERKIGWRSIKKAVKDLVDICGTNYSRELDGQPPLPVFLNRMFLGNPGTGKTTCAKLYGRVLKDLGFLTIGDVVFKTAGELGGSVVGESQQKTLDVLQGASGKVLVIDEAYNLDDRMYGKQVLDTLVEKVQGSENDDIAVLLLGYEEPMLAMLRNQNPGLARRFAPDQAFRFEDYDDNELLQILVDNCRRKGVKAGLEFQEKALKKLTMLRHSEANFGNAGAVENLLKAALLKASSRGSNDDGSLQLQACDIDIGPESAGSEDPFARLDKLYRMEGIKQKLQQLSNTFEVAQREGGELPPLGHFVFTGSPGTGKTTVARVMAQILYDLRLIGRNHVEETTGLNLTGQYVGQTKVKVEEKLDAAKGGVLFIDEAYELGSGPYGSEACTTIVAAMTNPKYAGVVIVIAGYQADISQMLDTNPGLKSRFQHFLEFPDWDPADCINLVSKLATAKSFVVEPAALTTLEDGFQALVHLEGWGNARDVNAIWEASLRNRANRVVHAPEVEHSITEVDVQPAVEELRSSRRSPAGISKRMSRPNGNLPTECQEADPPAAMPVRAKVQEDVREERCEPCFQSDEGRDAGVSDEVWAELEQAKAVAKAEEERFRQEEEKRRFEEEQRLAELERAWQEEQEHIRLELAEQERQEAERRARAEYEAKLAKERAEREERRRQEEMRRREAERKAQAIQEKLRQISPCPAGFHWYQTGGGWRCGGGSHFVSDAQLCNQFTF